MVKQYFLSIFLLSAAALNGMHAPNPTINVRRSRDGKSIVAGLVKINSDGHTVSHTIVTKNVATGTFDVEAGCTASDRRGMVYMERRQSPDQNRVDELKLMIAEFENKK